MNDDISDEIKGTTLTTTTCSRYHTKQSYLIFIAYEAQVVVTIYPVNIFPPLHSASSSSVVKFISTTFSKSAGKGP